MSVKILTKFRDNSSFFKYCYESSLLFSKLGNPGHGFSWERQNVARVNHRRTITMSTRKAMQFTRTTGLCMRWFLCSAFTGKTFSFRTEKEDQLLLSLVGFVYVRRSIVLVVLIRSDSNSVVSHFCSFNSIEKHNRKSLIKLKYFCICLIYLGFYESLRLYYLSWMCVILLGNNERLKRLC